MPKINHLWSDSQNLNQHQLLSRAKPTAFLPPSAHLSTTCEGYRVLHTLVLLSVGCIYGD